MTVDSSILLLLLQGLITAALLVTPVFAVVFGGRLRTTPSDILLALAAYPVLALLTFLVFAPFEGEWADATFSVVDALRTLLVGALALGLGMAITQWKALATRPGSEAMVRLGAAFAGGALWGAVWCFSGWFLFLIGVATHG
jgi:hypothetical protein